MLDMSDWIWLAVVVVWAVARVVPRIVRGLARKGTGSPATPASTPARESSPSGAIERAGDIGPGPIEPR